MFGSIWNNVPSMVPMEIASIRCLAPVGICSQMSWGLPLILLPPSETYELLRRPIRDGLPVGLEFRRIYFIVGVMKGRLVGLDALRGIAALVVVVICHPGYVVGPMYPRPFYEWAEPIFSRAETAVDLFFVISGFVFMHVYSGRETTGRQFALARFARLYPLHIVTLIATMLIFSFGMPRYLVNSQSDAYHLLLNVFMLQGTGLETGYSFNSPAWSISVEVICYAIFWFALRSRHFTWIAAALARRSCWRFPSSPLRQGNC
jgi:hypothetical protein